MAPPSTPLAFGVELELLVTSLKKYSSWHAMAGDISTRLRKRGLVSEVRDQPNLGYRVWSIVQEVTISIQPSKKYDWALELVSPVFTLDSRWLKDLEIIFSELQKGFKIRSSAQCSTHVHVSRTDGEFSPAQLASLAKAVLSYEPCLDQLIPPERASTYWCRSNRESPILSQGASLRDEFSLIDNASAQYSNPVAAVVETMCLFPASSAYGKAHGRKRDFVHGKVYKWNFSRLLSPDPGIRTIEYRQPAGSLCYEDAVGRVLLTVCFVAGAVGAPPTFGISIPTTAASMVEFWYLLCQGSINIALDPILLEHLRSFVARSGRVDGGELASLG